MASLIASNSSGDEGEIFTDSGNFVLGGHAKAVLCLNPARHLHQLLLADHTQRVR